MRFPCRRAVPVVLAVLAAVLAGSAGFAQSSPDVAALEKEVRDVEKAFAKSMADRDHAAFTTFLAEDTVFFGQRILRGRQEVAEGWRRFFDGPAAPFSWEPDRVAVTGSGTLALSSGPVYDPSGQRVGSFNSTWRREPDGSWRVVLDKGCDCP